MPGRTIGGNRALITQSSLPSSVLVAPTAGISGALIMAASVCEQVIQSNPWSAYMFLSARFLRIKDRFASIIGKGGTQLFDGNVAATQNKGNSLTRQALAEFERCR